MNAVFAPCDSPRVMMLPPGADFTARFLDGLRQKLAPHPPEIWAQTEIFVNTERSRRRLIALLESGPIIFRPTIRVFAELAQPSVDVTQTSDLEQRLQMAQLIRSLIAAEPDFAKRSAAIDLADTLARLQGEMQTEGVPWQTLDAIDIEDQSGHWQRNLRFLRLMEPFLSQPELAQQSREHNLRAAMLRLAKKWEQSPVSHPVIIAGSTGSRGASATFMKAVANLPQGAVVLPGFDTALPETVWDRLVSSEAQLDHPQYGYAVLSEMIGFDRAQVEPWHTLPPPSSDRNSLISLAMRPAPITDQWLSEGPNLIPTLATAMEGISLLEAPSQRQEALAIAIRMRLALEEGQKSALITPDRILARRVATFLDRWNIRPDDSAGRPLSLTPPGVFLRLVLSLFSDRITPATLMSVLKYPLTASGPDMRGPHLLNTRALEIDLLRGGSPVIEWDELSTWAAKKSDATARWMTWLRECLETPTFSSDHPLAVFLKIHLSLAERLAQGPDAETSELWLAEAGEKAKETFDKLQEASAHGGMLEPGDYRALLRNVLSGIEVPAAAYAPHPDVAIWGTLEARTETADVVILGALNDGTWPRIAKPDPWLNREMRRKIGLHLPERQIGLSAHDFQQSIGAKTVLMTRAVRDAQAPRVASRWWLRLTNLLGGLGETGISALEESFARGSKLLALADQFDRPSEAVKPASRPSPRPPLAARPTALAVTRIETLSSDPYSIYAQYVLGLRALHPLGRDPDARERGTISHAVLQKFVERTTDGLPEDASVLFASSVDQVLEETAPWPVEKTLWRIRLMQFRDWFLLSERERRNQAQPVALEKKGEASLDATPLPFTLRATADRIDLRPDGTVAIYDYKSSLPQQKEKLAIFTRQLVLEAAISMRGGFDGLPATKVEHLELIGLADGGKSRSVGGKTSEEISVELAQTWEGLNALISNYQNEATPYVARLRPDFIGYDSDYDQLSRLGEWSDGDPYEGDRND